MLKTISAALLAISVLAVPAMAAGIAKDTVKDTVAPVSKTTSAPVAKTAQAPMINAVQAKPGVLNANARMGRHHHRFHRHHRFHFHKHMGANKPNHFAKVTVKHVKTAIKRG
jgi:hypothetical protein